MSILKGVYSFVFSTLIVRLISLIVQFFLGWYLSVEDYGIFGMAISLGVFVSCFQQSGLRNLLIQKNGGKFKIEGIANEALFLGLFLSTLSGVILISIAYLYAAHRDEPFLILISLMLSIAGVVAFSVPVLRSKLSSDLRFSELAVIDTINNSVVNLTMIPLSIFGFGPMSFVIHRPFVQILEVYLYRRLLPNFNCTLSFRTLDFHLIRRLLWQMRWIAVGAIFTALSVKGDYLVLGFFVDASVLGFYFFGYQLTGAFANLISGSVFTNVFMPSFSRLNQEPLKQLEQFHISLLSMLMICFPIFISAAVFVEYCINFIWDYKWCESVLVAQLLLLGLPLRLCSPLLRALFEAQGKWRKTAAMLGVNGIGVAVAALIGGLTGSLKVIAVTAALWAVIYGIGVLIYGCRRRCDNQGIDRSVALSIVKVIISYGSLVLLYIGFCWQGHLDSSCLITALIYTMSGFLIIYVFFLRSEALMIIRSVFLPVYTKVCGRSL